MNARLYDPKLHRFLQPGNNIQDPFNTQNYNRYGYVMNNPLRYTDPSGEFWNVFFGYLFATYVKGAYESGGQLNPGKWTSNAWTSAFAGATSGVTSSYATGMANNYLDNYNNKPALGASAIGSGYDLSSFVNDDDYINVTKMNEKRGGIGDVIPCVACHHNLDRGDVFESELLQPESKFVNGALNTTFGVVGTIGAVAAIPETGGTSGLALSLTIGQASIGMAQMADSFNESPSEVLHNYSTIPGLIAGQRGSKYAPMIDFTSAWITGSVGNAPKLLGNTKGAWNSVNELSQGKKMLYNTISLYSTYGTYNSGYNIGYSLLFNNKQ